MLELGPWHPFYWLAAAGALAAVAWVAFAQQRRRLFLDREVGWWLWHWYTGGPLETGMAPTCPGEACFWRRAGLGAMRTSAVAGLVACEVARTAGPGVYRAPALVLYAYGGAVAAGAGAVACCWLAVRAAIYLWWVRPVAAAVRKLAGWGPKVAPWRFVRFRRHRGHWGLGLRVRVAATCDVEQGNLDKIVNAVRTRADIDLGDVDHAWRLDGRHSAVMFKPAARVPERVAWTDLDGTPNATVQAMVKATPAGVVWLGQGRDGVQVTIDLNRHPHVLVSAPTGAGKSAVARSIACQLMAKDDRCEVVNIDGKHLSQLWLRELPGAHNLHDAEPIHHALLDLAAEARGRVAHADTLPRREVDAYVAGLDRKVLLVEEAPTLMEWLQDWWRANRERGARDTSPAVLALREMLNMSRIAGYHIIGLAQRADAKAMGGGQARENYVWRILAAGYTRQAWGMLVPEIEYTPSEDRDGWAMACWGATATETQMLWLTDDDAEAWVAHRRGLLTAAATQRHAPATSTALTRPPQAPGTPQRLRVVGAGGGRHLGLVAGNVVGRTDERDDIELATLRGMVESGRLPTTLSALQRAAGRARRQGTFPAPVVPGNGPDGPQYWTEAVVRWWEQRPRAPKQRAAYQPLVYFLVAGGEPRYGDVVKIGRTDNLPNRLDQLAAHPNDEVHRIEVPTTQASKQLEAEHHRRWEGEVGDDGRSLRIYPDRELFRIEGALAAYLGVRREVAV
jgi:hypothetical protein